MSQHDGRIEVEEKQETAEKAAERERANRLRARQSALMQGLIEDDVFPAWIMVQLVKLGLTRLDPDPMPCDETQREHHWVNHEKALRRYRELKENPVPAPGPGRPWGNRKAMQAYEDQERDHLNRPPNPGTARCPLLSDPFEGDPPPCAHARRVLLRSISAEDDPAKYRQLADPADPVNALDMRPCQVLGWTLVEAVLRPIYRKQFEAEVRRWPAGKPLA